MRRGGERVVVGAALDGDGGREQADSPVAGGGDGPAHRGLDDLDDRDVVALAGVAQARAQALLQAMTSSFTRLLHQAVHGGERVPPHLGQRERAVRAVRGVADVEQRLAGQLVEQRAGDREPADAGVEDPDRRVTHARTLRNTAAAPALPCAEA